MDFCQISLSRNVKRETCLEVISEYDTDGDFSLNFQEFCNLVLPMANEQIRKYGLKVKKSKNSSKIVLKVNKEVLNYLVRIIDNEVYLAERKTMAKVQLNSDPDFDLVRKFSEVAGKHKEVITTDRLVHFIESNLLVDMRSFSIDGILRRCDHDADHALN